MPILINNKISIHLPWVFHDYCIDNYRMTEFGDYKLNKKKYSKTLTV
jgi:hypothetical protein